VDKTHDVAPVDSLRESDPAYPIVAAILRVVPASRWAFARPEANGKLGNFLGSHRDGSALAELRSENLRQREKSKIGPRIAANLGPLGDHESGVTLLFASGHSNFGILTLIRKSELGTFTSSEVAMLTLALDTASERLAALRLNASALSRSTADHRAGAPSFVARGGGERYLLDRHLQVVLTWASQEDSRAALTTLHPRLSDRLPAVLEDSVRTLTADWWTDASTQRPGVSRPVPFLVVRTQPASGPMGLFIGVEIDRFHPINSLVEAASRFHISSRELEVLALLLDGAKLEEIGKELNITTSTVQDHIKSMVDKTASRNRTELIARILGWESVSDTP